MKNLDFIKLGGSLITDKDKPRTARLEIIERLAGEIHDARKETKRKYVVGHGSGSFAHPEAVKYEIKKGVTSKNSYRGIALVEDAASDLNEIVRDYLLREGENAVSIQPSCALVAEDGRIKEWGTEPIRYMLKGDIIPLVYGDIVMDVKRGCSVISTEEVLRHLAGEFRPEKIVIAGITDGVFTKDPNRYEDAKLIPVITPKSYESIRSGLGGSKSKDVTGGMFSKVETMLELADSGIPSEIINGLREDCLRRALLGETGLGTTIRA